MLQIKRLVSRFVLLTLSLLSGYIVLEAQTPNWQWAQRAGDKLLDEGVAIAVDDNGNSYVTGYFLETAAFGDIELQSAGGYDIFVAKMDSSGNWIWARRAGGTGDDRGLSIAVDDNGNSYLTGHFMATATFGETELQSGGGLNIFVAKIDSTGNWIWARRAGGTLWDAGSDIAVDRNKNIYVTGFFRGIATFGETELQSVASWDIFVAKLDKEGNWVWAERAGGQGTNRGIGITVDINGNCYLIGHFQATAVFGEIELQSAGDWDIFAAKIDNEGNWVWAKRAGGTRNLWGTAIAIDSNGNSYVTGYFLGAATFGETNLQSAGDWDIFVAKLDSNGNWLWARRAGGRETVGSYSIAVDKNGNNYITGSFFGTATFGQTDLQSTGEADIFVAKIDNDGNWLWVARAGGKEDDRGSGIALDNNENCYVIGSFWSIATFGETELESAGRADIFIAKIKETVTYVDSTDLKPLIKLQQNYPNPFNPETNISFALSRNDLVNLSIYNIRGQLVKTLINKEYREQGNHNVLWNGVDNNGSSVSSGVYFYKLESDKESRVKKMILMK